MREIDRINSQFPEISYATNFKKKLQSLAHSKFGYVLRVREDGVLTEVNIFKALAEKISTLWGGIDRTDRTLVEYHLINVLEKLKKDDEQLAQQLAKRIGYQLINLPPKKRNESLRELSPSTLQSPVLEKNKSLGNSFKPNLLPMNGSDSNSFPLEARKNKGAILENMTPLFSELRVRASKEKIISNPTAFIGSKLGFKEEPKENEAEVEEIDTENEDVLSEDSVSREKKSWWSGLKVVLIGGGIVFGLSSAYAIQAFAPNLFSAMSPSSEGQNLTTYSKSSYGDLSFNPHSYTPLHSHKLTGALTLDILQGLEKLGSILRLNQLVAQEQQDWSSATKIVALVFGVGLLASIFKSVKDNSLHEACKIGDKSKVEKILKQGIDLNARDANGLTGLHWAVLNGHIEIVRYLVSQGADIFAKNHRGATACHLAAFAGDTDIVVYFVETNKKLLEMQNFVANTPLQLAAYNGHLKTVKKLVSMGANVSAQSIKKETPLHLAAYNGHTKVVRYLVSQGADPNLICKVGYPAFISALSYGHKKLATYLFNRTTPNNQAWLYHKWLNHRFGVHIGVVHEEEEITLGSFSSFIAFDHLHKSIVKNKNWLDKAPSGWNENDTKVITEAIAKATYFANFSKNKKTRIGEALIRYDNHQPLILPSGVENHAITLSFLNDFMVTGDRGLKIYSFSRMNAYPKLNVGRMTSYPHLHVRKMKNLSKINEIITNLILDFNSNLKGEYFVIDILNDLETMPPHACVEKKEQPGHICPWAAAKLGFQQVLLLYLFQKFFKEDNDEKGALEKAIDYSTHMFKSWVRKDRENFLNKYLTKVPDSNPYKAYILGCIYHHLEHKKSPDKELSALISSRCPEAVSIAEQVTVTVSKDNLRKYSQPHKTKISQHSDESLTLESTPAQNTFNSGTLIEKEPDNVSSLPIVPVSDDLDSKDNSEGVSLHEACKNGDKSKVEKILKKGIELNTRDAHGAKDLHWAAQNGHVEFVKYLVSQGADILAQNHYGITACHLAALNGATDIVAHFVNINKEVLEIQDHSGSIPLHYAAFNGRLETVKELVSKGANVILTQDHKGATACHLAAFKGATDIVAHFVNINKEVLEMQDCNANTSLHYAASNGRLETVKELVSRGANVSAQSIKKTTPLHIAAHNGHVEVVKYLVSQGADILTRDALDQTALHVAAQTGYANVVEYLISQGADPNLICGDGYPAFLSALSNGHENLAKDLFNRTTPDNQAWLYHKWINHRFGVHIGVVHKEKEITLGGFTQIITFDRLHKSILKNKSWLKKAPPSWNKNDTTVITKAIAKATYFANFSKDKKARVAEAIKRYHDHQLLILPSGIEDHVITLSFLNDFMVTGDRALMIYSNSPMEDYPKLKDYPKLNIPPMAPYPHLHMRKMKNLSKIDEIITNLILDFNSNLKSEYFNTHILNDLATDLPHACVEKKEQPGQICPWLAAKLGFQQALLLYLFQKFLKEGDNEEDASKKAEQYSISMFKSWVRQDREDFLNEYLANVPDSNPYKAFILGCIYHHLENKKSPDKKLLALISSRCPEAVNIAKQVYKDNFRMYSQAHKTKAGQHSDESLTLESTPAQNTFDSGTFIEEEPVFSSDTVSLK